MNQMANLYEACAQVNLHARAVDEMEFWEVAGALGMNRPPESQERSGRDLIAERLRAAEQGLSPPGAARPSRLPTELGNLIPIKGRVSDGP